MAFRFDQYWAKANFPSPSDNESADRELASFIEATEKFRDDEDPQVQQIANFGQEMANTKEAVAMLRAIFGNSPFLTQCVLRDLTWFQNLVQIGSDLASEEIIKSVRARKSQDLDEATTMRELRIAKRRMALTIALADIGEIWSWPTVTDNLSRFADETISVACAFALRKCAARGGLVLKSETEPEKACGYFVLAMGKLGAGELNYSSDIDLICLFDPERIETEDYDGLQSHDIRMTRSLSKILDERTTDGYVFRVDLRLRPDPGSTPLAISVLAAETYYESLGQNWERAAMIKARVVAGDIECGRAFLENLRPFVWRKSLDFAAIEDIHSIKRPNTCP